MQPSSLRVLFRSGVRHCPGLAHQKSLDSKCCSSVFTFFDFPCFPRQRQPMNATAGLSLIPSSRWDGLKRPTLASFLPIPSGRKTKGPRKRKTNCRHQVISRTAGAVYARPMRLYASWLILLPLSAASPRLEAV